jgi:Na+:H+ antiporter, NhaA family
LASPFAGLSSAPVLLAASAKTHYPITMHLTRKTLLPHRLQRFMQQEAAGGMVMILCALLAMIAANSTFAESYRALVYTPIGFNLGEATIAEPLKQWVKDILMAFFFLLIGLELKREMIEGVLAKRGNVALPAIAALAGMAVPALLFLWFNAHHAEYAHGWAIASATDIAFAVAIVALFGKRLPAAARIFLLAVAIFDDLGAILIIALFYNSALALTPLAFAAGCAALLWLLNRANICSIIPYALLGVMLWFALFQAGIHPTLAGVLVGIAIPMRNTLHASDSPVNHTIHALHPWVNFVILPIFAFTAAGVDVRTMDASMLLHPLPLGIALALFFGKQMGIFGSVFLCSKLRLLPLPQDARLRDMYAVSVIAGIGFTMSLFIGALAFHEAQLRDLVTIGVLAGSLAAALWGAMVLRVIR